MMKKYCCYALISAFTTFASSASEPPVAPGSFEPTKKSLTDADANTINQPPLQRIISADLLQVKGPRSMIWRNCVGAGRVAEGLRDGWRQQLEECHREIGFKYLRMHGLLQDELCLLYTSPSPRD